MNNPPQWILEDVIWDFAGQPRYLSESEFYQAVGKRYAEIEEYAPEIRASDWQTAQKISYDLAHIVIRYSYDDGSGIVTRSFDLDDLPKPLSANYLLFRIHNQVVDTLKDLAHTHFEGLMFVNIDSVGHPVYEMRLGS